MTNVYSKDGIWFESDGARLGAGRPIVFLHGGLADHRAALFRAGGVASSRRLVAPDLRGSGRSIYSGTLSWDQLADDVRALLDHLGLECAVVGGTSMGSGVAVRFGLRHPDRAAALVLMSPLYPGEDRPLSEAADAAMRVMGEAGERVLAQGPSALRPLFEPLPEPVRSVALEMMAGFDAASVAATTRFLASKAQPMASARELASISVPVMIIPGTDPQHPAEIAELYAAHVRHPIVVDPAGDVIESIVRFTS
jgi:pimeloyl-ACP methyl ester carboxylesterase